MQSNYSSALCKRRLLRLVTVAYVVSNFFTTRTSYAQDTGSNAHELRDVFIFAGQSNLAGADAILPSDFRFTSSDDNTLYTGGPLPLGSRSPFYCPWGKMKGHLSSYSHNDKKVSVIGPEVGFARRLDEAGIKNIAIIAAWANFSKDAEKWPWRDGGELNNTWMAFVDERLAELRKMGFEPRIQGFVWHQGIDDAIHGRLAMSYRENLTALIQTLRKRFHVENAPFLIARSVNSPVARRATGDGDNAPMGIVRTAQVAIADTVSNAAWINVDDLPNVNRHHFSAESQIVIGRRFGEAYLKLIAKQHTANPL
jgi:hypothetical protein